MRIQQVSVEAFDCGVPLDVPTTLRPLVDALVREIGATVCGEVVHEFVPHGVTLVAILAESHLVLSTWPEHQYVHVDIVWSGCVLPDEAIRLAVAKILRADRVTLHSIGHEGPESAQIAMHRLQRQVTVSKG